VDGAKTRCPRMRDGAARPTGRQATRRPIRAEVAPRPLGAPGTLCFCPRALD
jgi:hypothetical protein